jgi:hypothetical protein
VRTRFGQPTGQSPATEDAQQRPLSPGLRSSRQHQGSLSGGVWITDCYTGMQLTTFSEVRLHTLVSLGQQMLATMTPPGPAALQQKNPSGQQVSVP